MVRQMPDHFFARVIDPMPATRLSNMVLTQTDVHSQPWGRLTLLPLPRNPIGPSLS